MQDADDPRSRAVVATVMARLGARPVAVSGVRLALDRGSGVRAVPVWSSLVGLVVAATTLIGAITFGAGLTYLLDTPRLIGWNWDVAMTFPDGEESASPAEMERRGKHLAEKVSAAPEVQASAAVQFFPPFPQGRPLQLGPKRIEANLMGFDSAGAVGPAVISGRAPRSADEILLGRQTLDALGLRVGDTVDAFGQAGTWEKPGKETSARMRVVGTGVVSFGAELGQGATMSLDGVRRLNPSSTPDGVLVQPRARRG